MAEFNTNDKVINVNSLEKGVIIEVLPSGRGRQLYSVRYGSGDRDELEINLISDTDITNPFECCKQGVFGSYLDFSRINTTFKIDNTSNNTISSLKASRTIFKPYQFIPLVKFLNSTNRRLLIADEVGLGKTIEAGNIMMELEARRELRNVLIICPKMLHEKWKAELEEKFNFAFKIYDKKELADELRKGIVRVRGIVNYETIRSSKKNNEEQNPILKLFTEHDVKFDLILCDEAHRMRNSGTKTYKGAEVLIPSSSSAVFLTATPIMIGEENLYNLLHLLDNQQFDNYGIFLNNLSANKPFIAAISQLNNDVNLLKIADELKKKEVYMYYDDDIVCATVEEKYADNDLYKKIIADLTQPDIIDERAHRVQLQFDLSSISLMNNIFSRTRKCEVTTDWSQPIRVPDKIQVELYTDERERFDKVIDDYIKDNAYIDEYGDAKLPPGHALGLIQKKRRIASCIYAYLNDVDNLDRGYDEFFHYPDAKFDKLITIIEKNVVDNKKIIVFALFKSTLKYLNIRLQKKGYKPAIIHGDIKDRDDIIRSFKTDHSVNVLLSSEVGSEGLDLQFCDALVNYDLPWNPMVVEQRIGRIDRFGQKSDKVFIYNLIVKDSIQELIYDRLLDRIGIFRSCIGDLEAILETEIETETSKKTTLKKSFHQLEEDLYCQELSNEEIESKIERIEKAILFEKRHLEDINEGLTDTLTNDTYFRNEIEKIEKNYRYITDHELYNYMQSLIRNRLTECSLIKTGDNIYRLRRPLSNISYITNFLDEYGVNDDTETGLMFRKFRNSIKEVSEFELTFNQETAYNNQGLIFVNSYHPLIIAAKEYFKQKFKQTNSAFQFGIKKEQLPQISFGKYFLATYSICITRKWFGKAQNNELLVPIVFDIQSDSIIDDKNIAERFLGESQLYATVNQDPYQPDQQLIANLRGDMAAKINSIFVDHVKDQKMRLDSSKKQQIQQIEEYHNNRINRQKQTVIEHEDKAYNSSSENERANFQKSLILQQNRVIRLEEDKKEAIKKINDSEIQGDFKLLSLSLINVY